MSAAWTRSGEPYLHRPLRPRMSRGVYAVTYASWAEVQGESVRPLLPPEPEPA